MSETQQQIPCPVCQTPILFNYTALFSGVVFKCPNLTCDAQISMTQEAKAIADKALQEYEKIKKLPSQ